MFLAGKECFSVEFVADCFSHVGDIPVAARPLEEGRVCVDGFTGVVNLGSWVLVRDVQIG